MSKVLNTVEDCDREISRIDRSMEAMQTLLHLKAGDVLTQAQLDDLIFLDEYHRSEEDTALNVFNNGYECGLKRAAGTDGAKLIEERDSARTQVTVTKLMGRYVARGEFIRGAQMCREMMARFVEQGGDATTAGSIRANWRPSWGGDPGTPSEDAYLVAQPRPMRDEDEDGPASVDRSGEADETSTKIEGSAEGESAVTAEGGQTPNV